MSMGIEGRILARTNAPYHVQLQLDEKPRSLGKGHILGRVIRVFRSDGRLTVGQNVSFKIWVCQPGDEPTGPAFVHYEPLMQASHLEIYLFGTPPKCELGAYEFELLNAPTDEPVMTIAQLEKWSVMSPFSDEETIPEGRWWERLLHWMHAAGKN